MNALVVLDDERPASAERKEKLAALHGLAREGLALEECGELLRSQSRAAAALAAYLSAPHAEREAADEVGKATALAALKGPAPRAKSPEDFLGKVSLLNTSTKRLAKRYAGRVELS